MQHNFPNRQRLESTHKRYETKRITPTYCSVRNFKIRCLRSSSRMFLDTYPMDMHAYRHISWILQTISLKRSHNKPWRRATDFNTRGWPASQAMCHSHVFLYTFLRKIIQVKVPAKKRIKYLSRAPAIQLRRKLQNPHDDAASLLASDTPNALQE